MSIHHLPERMPVTRAELRRLPAEGCGFCPHILGYDWGAGDFCV